MTTIEFAVLFGVGSTLIIISYILEQMQHPATAPTQEKVLTRSQQIEKKLIYYVDCEYNKPIDIGRLCVAISNMYNIQITYCMFNNLTNNMVLTIESFEPSPLFEAELEYDCGLDFHQQHEKVFETIEQLFEHEEWSKNADESDD